MRGVIVSAQEMWHEQGVITGRLSMGGVNEWSNTYLNKKDLEILQVWNYIIEDDLNEWIDITYTNKIHLLFDSLSLKNSIVKHVWLETILG